MCASQAFGDARAAAVERGRGTIERQGGLHPDQAHLRRSGHAPLHVGALARNIWVVPGADIRVVPGAALQSMPGVLHQLLGVERRAFHKAPWSRNRLEAYSDHMLVLAQDHSKRRSKIYGYAVVVRPSEYTPLNGPQLVRKDGAYLAHLAIDPLFGKLGLGGFLIDSVIQHAATTMQQDTVFLDVREPNHSARAFYIKRGFSEDSTLPKVYPNLKVLDKHGNPTLEDGIRMIRSTRD